tara:strand:+ start:145 stop:408 length:264 start_codon:yes stop_codon:yes gene_type:complete
VIYAAGDLVEIKREKTVIDSIFGVTKSHDTISGLIVYGLVSSCYIMDRPYRIEDIASYTVVVEGKKRCVKEGQIIRKIEGDEDDQGR